jgi:5,10-methylenetetrahydromethanopterin reductase
MQIGVLLDILWDWPRIERLARLADELGYDRLWFNDQPLGRDPFLALLRLAPSLHCVGLGVATVNPSTRHPVVLAASTATLAEATPTSFWLGISSSTAALLTPIGLGLGQRAQRCREALLIVRQLLEDGRSTFSGQVFTTSGAELLMSTSARVPVLVGASGGPEMLRMSAEVAHGIIMPAGNSNFYDGMVRAFRALWTRDARAEIVAVGNIAVAADAHIALRDVRPAIAAALDYRAANPHSLRYMAITREQALAWKAHPETIPDAVVRDTGVVGTPDDCVKRLEDLADLGITQFVLRFPDESTIRAFGEQVLPRIRARPA